MTSNPKRFRYVELGLAIVLVAVLTVVSTGSIAPGQAAPVSVATPAAARADASVETANTIVGRAEFQVGYDYTWDAPVPSATGQKPAAVSSAKRLLTSLDTFQNVALMGWGAGDPEPRPGTYRWSSLDNRVEAMGSTVPADQRMITLCSAPGWMKVGGVRQEWNMNAAVAHAHFEDFAHLAAQVAERYDGTHVGANGQRLPRVDYFDVWNEMKGFWNPSAHTWNYQDYTTMYNDVYRAIRAVRPGAQVGGPYAPVGAASSTNHPSSIRGSFGVVDQRALNIITYWLQHKVGAQFISMDGGPAATRSNVFASGDYFVAVTNWLRGLKNVTHPGAATLPIVWAEFYPGLKSTAGTVKGQEAVAVDMSNILQAGRAGVNYMLIWDMEGNAAGVSPWTGESVWTDTVNTDGGTPTSFYTALDELHRAFPPGTALYKDTLRGNISAIAGEEYVFLVSHSASSMVVDVNNKDVALGPFATAVVHRTD